MRTTPASWCQLHKSPCCRKILSASSCQPVIRPVLKEIYPWSLSCRAHCQRVRHFCAISCIRTSVRRRSGNKALSQALHDKEESFSSIAEQVRFFYCSCFMGPKSGVELTPFWPRRAAGKQRGIHNSTHLFWIQKSCQPLDIMKQSMLYLLPGSCSSLNFSLINWMGIEIEQIWRRRNEIFSSSLHLIKETFNGNDGQMKELNFG